MKPDAEYRMRVYQEGQRSARDENAVCPYELFDWRQGTWWKGRKAAQDYNAREDALITQQTEPVVEPEETYRAVPMKTVRTGVVTGDKQAEPDAVLAEREAIIDIVAMHGGSVEIEAAIRARGIK